MAIAKCARCKKPFDRIKSQVCSQCQSQEDADYQKIRDLLLDHPNLNAQEVADRAEVEVTCVMRMLDDGQIANVNLLDAVTCGRCGGRAISFNKRLCQSCLDKLNREMLTSVNAIRQDLGDKRPQPTGSHLGHGRTQANTVHQAVEQKRLGRTKRPSS
jgi:predicted amidophosphoribosyltransferase